MLSIDNVIQLIPKNLKNRARQLLLHIKQSNALKWDSTGRIEIQDHTLQATSIVDLVRYATQSNKHSSFIPNKFREFICALSKTNPPLSLLNREAQKLITQSDHQEPDKKHNYQTRSQKGSGKLKKSKKEFTWVSY